MARHRPWLDPAIQEISVFFWMAASEGGHDDEIGGNIGVIRFRDDALIFLAY
jgi:hypothetical protein